MKRYKGWPATDRKMWFLANLTVVLFQATPQPILSGSISLRTGSTISYPTWWSLIFIIGSLYGSSCFTTKATEKYGVAMYYISPCPSGSFFAEETKKCWHLQHFLSVTANALCCLLTSPALPSWWLSSCDQISRQS